MLFLANASHFSLDMNNNILLHRNMGFTLLTNPVWFPACSNAKLKVISNSCTLPKMPAWSFGWSLSHALLPCVLYWPQPVWEHNILVFFLDLNLDKVLEKENKTQCLLCHSQWHCSLFLTKAKPYSSRKKWNTDLPKFRLGSFAAVNQIWVLEVCF